LGGDTPKSEARDQSLAGGLAARDKPPIFQRCDLFLFELSAGHGVAIASSDRPHSRDPAAGSVIPAIGFSSTGRPLEPSSRERQLTAGRGGIPQRADRGPRSMILALAREGERVLLV
jgi:hypothetical protein